MPELVEQMYCSQQIVVPPKFPYILKRFCKAAIKTQPYDLLRWSFEYFKALAHHKPPPVKLRLEYPVFATEGGLTRGCLKVMAHQMADMTQIPLPAVKAAWAGFCLDSNELKRIFCLCDVYLRADHVPFLHFIAVAGGLLTKSLTHTMILLCETLTAEPDGGSAAIPVKDFLLMYRFLAHMDASKDICYYDGYREGEAPVVEAEEEVAEEEPVSELRELSYDGFWGDQTQEPLHLQKLSLIDDIVARNPRLSMKLYAPTMGPIERSPSIERAKLIERENYLMERKAKYIPRNEDAVDKMLKEMSSAKLHSTVEVIKDEQKVKEEQKTPVKEEKGVERTDQEAFDIFVFDEDGNEIPYQFYGQPKLSQYDHLDEEEAQPEELKVTEEEIKKEEAISAVAIEADEIQLMIAEQFKSRAERLEDLETTFEEIANLVDRYNTANYDLGMVAGRQMSTTSGEFIVQHIEREIMAYIDEQIAILPDPDLKKKKAKPEEVAMIRQLLQTFLDENMDIICAEVEEVEEEEIPIPDVVTVYAVPGIGPPVDVDIIKEFEEYLHEAVKVQAELFMPRNIRHFLCPPLEKYVEYDYGYQGASKKKEEKKEEAPPTAGAITD